MLVILSALILAIRSQPPAASALLPESSPTNTSTATNTTTPSITPTITPTRRPTLTPEPTHTPTITPTSSPTPTRTLPPSLTPAFPLGENERYHLVGWNPETAERAIRLLEAYPETLSAFSRGEDDSGYYAAFNFAIFALREALHHFPDISASDGWHWSLAYNLARSRDPAAGPAFAALITQSLNAGTFRLSDLPQWALAQDPPARIELIPLPDSSGSSASDLISVNLYPHGSAAFWLLETNAGFASYPLATHFDFRHTTSLGIVTADLTRDGFPEAVIYPSLPPGSTTYDHPWVFDLSVQPPRLLPFESFPPPEVSQDFSSGWTALESAAGSGGLVRDLQFVASVFPACPVTVSHTYSWNEETFRFASADYTIDPAPHLLSYCSFIIDHAINVWGPAAAISIMESILLSWPSDEESDQDPLPAETFDEWRFRLGVYHALLGQHHQARGYLEAILASPAAPQSSWLAPAREFLEAYQDQGDIYRACLPAPHCKPDQALQSLVATFSATDYDLAPRLLQEGGVMMSSSGFFDFDDDGLPERWLIIRHGESRRLEFWILARTEQGAEALFVSPVDTSNPNLAPLEPLTNPLMINLAPGITFTLEYRDGRQDPMILRQRPRMVFSVDLTQQALDRLGLALLTGVDPIQVREELLRLKASSIFTCNYATCTQYFYTLGLANELAGHEQNAIDAYLELWREYPRHPFATMARLKLSGAAVLPTNTPSPTSTITPTTTPTPTITGTLPTITPTITPTSTSTVDETATPSSTPTEIGTPSATPSG
jgi:hypothetical protein